MSNHEDTSSSEAPLSTEWGGEGGGVKRCSRCRETKPFAAFYKDRRKRDGLQSRCKACRAEYDCAHYAANADARCNQVRTYYAANAKTIGAQKRAYRAANAEAIRQYLRAYQATHTEEARAHNRAYRAANADYVRQYSRAHRAANPDLYRAKHHRRRARLEGNGGIFTAQELKHMRLTQGGFCAYCQRHYPKLTIDHIIPITQGGCHEAANICLACPRCNSSKNDRTPDQWLNRWYWDWRQRETDHIPLYWYKQ